MSSVQLPPSSRNLQRVPVTCQELEELGLWLTPEGDVVQLTGQIQPVQAVGQN